MDWGNDGHGVEESGREMKGRKSGKVKGTFDIAACDYDFDRQLIGAGCWDRGIVDGGVEGRGWVDDDFFHDPC